MQGIDVSKHQRAGEIDWNEIADTQDFVIVRASYGATADSAFASHVRGAFAAGLQVGAYHWVKQSVPAALQFRAFDAQLRALGDCLTIAPVLDLEDAPQFDAPWNPKAYESKARELARLVWQGWGRPMVYIAPGFFQRMGSPGWLLSLPWWVAHWGVEAPKAPAGADLAVWQYSDSGTVHGYSGALDLNQAFRLPSYGVPGPAPFAGAAGGGGFLAVAAASAAGLLAYLWSR